MRLSARRPAPMLTSHATCTPQTLAHRVHTSSHLLIALLLPPSLKGEQSATLLLILSSSLPPPQPRPPRRVRVAAEENHYHICRVRLRTSRRLFGLSASRVGTKCKAAARLVGGQREVGRGERNGGIDRLCLFIDVYLLAFTRLITL